MVRSAEFRAVYCCFDHLGCSTKIRRRGVLLRGENGEENYGAVDLCSSCRSCLESDTVRKIPYAHEVRLNESKDVK